MYKIDTCWYDFIWIDWWNKYMITVRLEYLLLSYTSLLMVFKKPCYIWVLSCVYPISHDKIGLGVTYECIYNSNTRIFWYSDNPTCLKIILGDNIQKYITLGPTTLMWYIFGYYHLEWFSITSGYLSIKFFSYSRCIYTHINLDFVSVDMSNISHSGLRPSWDIFHISLLDQSCRVI